VPTSARLVDPTQVMSDSTVGQTVRQYSHRCQSNRRSLWASCFVHVWLTTEGRFCVIFVKTEDSFICQQVGLWSCSCSSHITACQNTTRAASN